MSPEPEKLTEDDLIALARLEGKPMPNRLKQKVLEEIQMIPEQGNEKTLRELIDERKKISPENDSPEFEL